MTAAPRLLTGKRRGLAALLVLLAVAEAVLAVLFAAAIDRLLANSAAPAMAALATGGIAAMAGTVLILARWVGEDFAQSFVTECRAVLFAAAVRQAKADQSKGNGAAGGSSDARWLTVLINDMAALRNYALRGTVRLWTSAIAASAAAAWVASTMPQLRAGLIPLVIGAGAITLLAWPLSHAIIAQRRQRGRLNRFLVRRVRAELSGIPATNGHGFRKLTQLSGELAQTSVYRALNAGAMDAAATLAGLAAALVIVWQTVGGHSAAGLAGSLTLFGFIAARLLESARALHARVGGRIALERLAGLIAPVRKPRQPPTSPPRPTPSGPPSPLRLSHSPPQSPSKEPRT